jgi:hypothetical protein
MAHGLQADEAPSARSVPKFVHHSHGWPQDYGMTPDEPQREINEKAERRPAGELRRDDRGQDEVLEAAEESIGLGQARPLTREEREAAARDSGEVKTVYAPASERVAKPPLPSDEKLINQKNQ